MVVCLERGADLYIAQLMPLPLTASCFSKIQIGFTFLVPAHPGSPGKRAIKRVSVCVMCVYIVEADDEVDLMAAAAVAGGGGAGEVGVETQLSTYLQLQMHLFRSVVTAAAHGGRRDDDDAHVHDLVDRFGTLQDRQMSIVDAIQQSRHDAEHVSPLRYKLHKIHRVPDK